jgi:radical SAM protein with 4Fe4S-binding SPASM domain
MIDTSKINPDNKIFCIAPWLSLNINQNGDVQPCCITSDHKFGNVLHEDIKDIWNNEKIREFRKNMIEQIPVNSCTACYDKEISGQKSLRQSFNQSLFHHGSQFIYDTNEDYSVNEFGFIHWDVKFGNKCNFKCRSCCPGSSSSIEFEQNGKLSPFNDFSKINFNRIKPYINIVNHLYFSGGEPLIIEEHYKMIVMLMKLEKHKDEGFYLNYNTNFSTLKYKKYHIFDIWDKFQNVFVSISIDGSYKRGELLRNGFKWDKFVSHVEQFNERFKNREETHRLEFACTVQALNIFDVVTLHKTLFEKGLIYDIDDYHLNFLHGPRNIAVWLLNEKTKEKAKENIRNHIDNFLIPNKAVGTISAFEGLINYIDLYQEQHLIPEFINKMNYLDLKREENTFKTFPELKDTWYTNLK